MIRKRFEKKGIWVEKLHPKLDQYAAWKPNVSQYFDDKRALLKWLKWPKGTPTGDEFREWLGPLDVPVPDEIDPTANTKTII
jgi:hypothetical protein